MNLWSDSSSSCWMFVSATIGKWCALLIMYWAPKCTISVMKESIEFLGKRMYQWSVEPLRFIRNTWHIMTSSFVNRFICVTDASICSSGSESPSYQSIVNVFHPNGCCASMMSSMKGWIQFFILWIGWVTHGVPSPHVVPASSVLHWLVQRVVTVETECVLLSS